MKKENKITYCECKRPFRWKWHDGGKEVCAICFDFVRTSKTKKLVETKVPAWQEN